MTTSRNGLKVCELQAIDVDNSPVALLVAPCNDIALLDTMLKLNGSSIAKVQYRISKAEKAML